MDVETLEFRAETFRAIRDFFTERGYLEVDTPSLCRTAIPESCLEVFKTDYEVPFRDETQPLCLLPSPEIYMKKLIAATRRSIFQLCHSFRNCESVGRLHSVEFEMLEYYTMDFSAKDSIALTEDFISTLADKMARFSGGDAAAVFRPPFVKITCDEAFFRATGRRLSEADDVAAMRKIAENLGLCVGSEWSWADAYNLIFVHKIEPRLDELAAAKGRPVFLCDYPAKIPCLALSAADANFKERWELYADGIELANCYSEQRDAAEVRKFFEDEARAKASMRVPHAVDGEYWRIFENFPRCSGVAMGVDRLLALLLGKHSIAAVMPFPDFK